MKALHILIKKLEQFTFELERANEKDNSAMVEIHETDTQLVNGYDIHIKDENHTLGYLLQDTLLSFTENGLVRFSGYMNPHPLQKVIIIRVQFAVGIRIGEIVDEIKKMVSVIKSYLNNMYNNIAGEFSGDMSRKE